jgi:hypothetical protein
MRTWSALGALVFVSMSPLAGSILTVSSQGTAVDVNESNDVSGSNVALSTTDALWGILPGASWISYANTVCPGCPGNPPLSGQVFYDPSPSQPFVTFTEIFDIPTGLVPVGGTLNILGDDSISVFLNNSSSSTKAGYAPYSEAFIEPASGPFNFQLNSGNGIGGGIGYTSGLQLALVPGQNVLIFLVTNLGTNDLGLNGDGTGGISSFGLAYILTLDLRPEDEAFSGDMIDQVPPAFLPDSMPEPSTMALMALGGLGLLGYSRYRRAARNG